jgi:UDP-N-acetylglucosamine diphosphorylase / glucose-1-phosphate thymidylyltransferase / UDP-N-acetylgalactosamine diphosphorylase / glucosamine-1-phosphate N-acetyltransferase / galactosamine-1-phosphate N-acetyltransferase
VFEDEGITGFGPLTLLRHTSLLRLGTKPLLDVLVETIPDATDVGIWGRRELAAVTKDSTGRQYNEKVHGPAFLVNARAAPSEGLLSLASRQEPFAAMSGGELVAARLDHVASKPGVLGKSETTRMARATERVGVTPDSLFQGYWSLVQRNGLAIAEQAKRFDDSMQIPRTVEVRGPSANVMVHSGADIEGHVTLDARLGPIVIDEGAAVESFSRVMGPCYIGARARISSALIGGGTSIFESCKVGGQVENSVMMPFTNKAHHGYLGDSYVGSWVNLGAGCTFSNLKNTYGNVRLNLGGKKIDSGMVKLGPVVGDMAKLSIGALVYAGKSVGTGSHVSGLAAEDVPSFSFCDSGGGKKVELLLESVLETQRRMKERRGLTLSRNEETLIRKAFASTAMERRKAGAKKGALK